MNEFPKPSISEVFEHYGLKLIGPDRGGWRKAECPVPDHEDRNPSASVNEDACRWYCHACGRGGDAIDLIQEVESGIGIASAIERAKELLGDDDGAVREQRGRSGLLPRKQGHRPGRSNFKAPWTRL